MHLRPWRRPARMPCPISSQLLPTCSTSWSPWSPPVSSRCFPCELGCLANQALLFASSIVCCPRQQGQEACLLDPMVMVQLATQNACWSSNIGLLELEAQWLCVISLNALHGTIALEHVFATSLVMTHILVCTAFVMSHGSAQPACLQNCEKRKRS